VPQCYLKSSRDPVILLGTNGSGLYPEALSDVQPPLFSYGRVADLEVPARKVRATDEELAGLIPLVLLCFLEFQFQLSDLPFKLRGRGVTTRLGPDRMERPE
jgi:hypothetical protein